jgi:hypothetical protein
LASSTLTSYQTPRSRFGNRDHQEERQDYARDGMLL